MLGRKYPEGSWKCPTCLVMNGPDELKCPCCETPKPGTAGDQQAAATANPFANLSSSSSEPPNPFASLMAPSSNPFAGLSANTTSNPFAGLSTSTLNPFAPISTNSAAQSSQNNPFDTVKTGDSASLFTASTTDCLPSAAPGPLFIIKPAPKDDSNLKKQLRKLEFKPVDEKLFADVDVLADPVYSTDLSRRKMGTVFVVGNGDCAQLGAGPDIMESDEWFAVPQVNDDIVDVDAGGLHNIVVSKTGQLISWGCNDDNALGRAGPENYAAPITMPQPIRFVQVSCGDCHCAAITDNGKVYSWGTYKGKEGYIGFDEFNKKQATPALMKSITGACVQVACGNDHTVALTKTGKVFTWGYFDQGQLGRPIVNMRFRGGEDGSGRSTWKQKKAYMTPSQCRFPGLKCKTATFVACGSYFSYAIMSNGSVTSWGLNNYGQLGAGVGDTANRSIPIEIKGFEGKNIVFISGGMHHSIALSRNGHVYVLGRGDSGQLGDGENSIGHQAETPQLVEFFNNIPVKFVCAGSNHNMALTLENEVYTWGYGDMGQLGHGQCDDELYPKLLSGKLFEGSEIITMSAGAQHSLLLVHESTESRKRRISSISVSEGDESESDAEPPSKRAKTE